LRRVSTLRSLRLVVVVGLLLIVLPPGVESASAAATVDGTGSTWSQIAVDQWRADVARAGLTINYQGVGSTQGRKDFIAGANDFAVSEIPFQGPTFGRDGSQIDSGELGTPALANHPYSYMPIVAGGTSLMYHLDVNGERITDLHLSGQTIARIFTGQITDWSDPAITADNGGRQLPSIHVLPVVRSDGSGTSAQFSAYLYNQFPDVYCSMGGLPNPCAPTSLWPQFPGSVAQVYSDGVTNFVAADYNNGAITYVEYGYPFKIGFPVASVLNAAGYYVQPTPGNVAVGLLAAQQNPDHTLNLAGVYVNPDPRSYPISSYSYMIVPTSTNPPFNADKGAVLGRFILYFACDGQQKAAQLGYSPLPRNLVQFVFETEVLIPGAPAPPAIDDCNNPTIKGEFSPDQVPQPSPDSKVGTRVGGPAGGGPGSDTGPNAAATAAANDTVTTAADQTALGASSPQAAAQTAADPRRAAELTKELRSTPRQVNAAARALPMVVSVVAALALVALVCGPPVLFGLRKRNTQE
jgi:phosphate transport system substrate-binding protein